MKFILGAILFACLVLCCQETTTNPTQPTTSTIYVNVLYHRPYTTESNSQTTISKLYSSTASISWNGGNTSVPNRSTSTKIYVLKGATLQAYYTETRSTTNNDTGLPTHGGNYTSDINKSHTASTEGVTWTL